MTHKVNTMRLVRFLNGLNLYDKEWLVRMLSDDLVIFVEDPKLGIARAYSVEDPNEPSTARVGINGRSIQIFITHGEDETE